MEECPIVFQTILQKLFSAMNVVNLDQVNANGDQLSLTTPEQML